ncbi:MAG TPA: hypothetical protein LFV92_03100 [Rickettsia endosymbiont of Ceroptres masudai]|nr:hypothetical protein [Rickettsia endosymbiont of Ceroptres masudai]
MRGSVKHCVIPWSSHGMTEVNDPRKQTLRDIIPTLTFKLKSYIKYCHMLL